MSIDGVFTHDSLQYSSVPSGARNTISIRSGRLVFKFCIAPTVLVSVPNPPTCTVLSRLTASRRTREGFPLLGRGVHFPAAGIRSRLTAVLPRSIDTMRS